MHVCNITLAGLQDYLKYGISSGEIEMKDIWDGEQVMEGMMEEKYLGDVISTDGRNLKNIKAGIAKGKKDSQ